MIQHKCFYQKNQIFTCTLCNGLRILVPFFSFLHHLDNKYFCDPYLVEALIEACGIWQQAKPMRTRQKEQTVISAKEKMKQEVVMIGGGETGPFLHNQLLSVYYETNVNRTQSSLSVNCYCWRGASRPQPPGSPFLSL